METTLRGGRTERWKGGGRVGGSRGGREGGMPVFQVLEGTGRQHLTFDLLLWRTWDEAKGRTRETGRSLSTTFRTHSMIWTSHIGEKNASICNKKGGKSTKKGVYKNLRTSGCRRRSKTKRHTRQRVGGKKTRLVKGHQKIDQRHEAQERKGAH